MSHNTITKSEIDALVSLYSQKKFPLVIERASVLAGQFPNEFVIHNILGAAYAGLGRFQEAIASYRRATEIAPKHAATHNSLGNAQKRLGQFREAVSSYRRALKFEPRDANAHCNLGSALRELGRLDKSVASSRQAIALDPKLAAAHNNLGVALGDLGKLEEAVASYSRAIEINPGFEGAHNNLGAALKGLGRLEEAAASYRRAVKLRPDFAGAWVNLGHTARDLGRLDEAEAAYRRSIELNPRAAEPYVRLGSVLRTQGHLDEAIELYRKAIKLKPDFIDAYLGNGNALQSKGRLDEAVASYARAVEVRPDHAEALSHLLFYRANICDWTAELPKGISKLGTSGATVSPFRMLAFEDNPENHFRRARNYVATNTRKPASTDLTRPQSRPDKLRIGYFSADFRDHAVMYLAARVFELHDRERFTIHAYSHGPDRRDEMRTRLEAAMDSFTDVRDKNDREVVELARKDGLDIAVDLSGLTGGTRLGIFANRVAPVQMTWLGYPGTSGADFMDYVVADQVVIPKEARSYYSEAVLYLPHAYQPNDDQRTISERMFTRTELGLPENGFVFCCFNNNYKITPREFDIWARLLTQVNDSVLWLLKSNQWAETNLRAEAKRRGIDPARLVFAERVPLADHLARHRLADLFLDTFNYNAHTTASDALWAGLPLVTKQGRGFAARVASSLLSAVKLEELITHSDEDYEQLALDLATNPEKLGSVRDKLSVNRDTEPLFNSETFTRHIESGYVAAYERVLAGLKPETIHVAD